MCKNTFANASAFWHMSNLVSGGKNPLDLESMKVITQTEELEGELKVSSIERGGNGCCAIFDNEQCYKVTNENAKVLITEDNAVTLFSRVWISNIINAGTIFFSDYLGLVIKENGLAVCFICENIPSGVVMREIPLAFVENNSWLDLVIRIGDIKLDFFCNGTLLNSIKLSGSLCPSYPFDYTIGALAFGVFGSNKRGYFNGKIDHIAIWTQALSDTEIASLSGLQELNLLNSNEILDVLKAYNNIFNASVSKDVKACYEQEQVIRKIMNNDSHRPTYHLTAPMGWMFDPAGAYYYQGKYHVFTYRNVCFLLKHNSLDHYVSDDLVHWKQWPIGPFADCSLDFRGIWLNNHFIDDNGVLSAIYTALGYDEKGFTKKGILAQSYDGMVSFENKKAVIEKHHDGHTWKDGDTWYTITTYQYEGSRPGDDGDDVVLLCSKDLENWDVIGPIFTKKKNKNENAFHREKDGFTEFPYLLNFGDKDVLILGGNPTSYYVGHFDKNTFKFIPDNPDDDAYALDFANPFHCDNPMIVDNKGPNGKPRRVVLALVSDAQGIYKGVEWNGALTLPRTLELVDNHLHQEPVSEIESLRGMHIRKTNIKVESETSGYIDKHGNSLEIIAEFEPCDALAFGLKVCLSKDNKTFVKIFYDTTTGEYGMEGNYKKEWGIASAEWGLASANIFGLGKGPAFVKKGDNIVMRVFIDKCIVESYLNGQPCTAVLQDNNLNNNRLDLFSEGGTVMCKSLDIWDIIL